MAKSWVGWSSESYLRIFKRRRKTHTQNHDDEALNPHWHCGKLSKSKSTKCSIFWPGRNKWLLSHDHTSVFGSTGTNQKHLIIIIIANYCFSCQTQTAGKSTARGKLKEAFAFTILIVILTVYAFVVALVVEDGCCDLCFAEILQKKWSCDCFTHISNDCGKGLLFTGLFFTAVLAFHEANSL